VDTIKKNKNGKLSVSNKRVSVPPPQGFHWMEENGRYFLMEGEYTSHPNAIEEAKFKTAVHGKSGKEK